MTDLRSNQSKINGVLGGRPVQYFPFEEIENELWKVVSDFPNYMVSNFGRILSTKNGKLMATKSNRGYRQVLFSKNGDGYIRKTLSVHRIVAEAFLGKSDLHIDHINMDKTDNRVENLEYVTPAENNRRRLLFISKTKMIGITRRKSEKKPWQSQIMIRNKSYYLGCYETQSEALSARNKFLETFIPDEKTSVKHVHWLVDSIKMEACKK